MKILMLIDSLDIGGAETHVLTLACAMRQSGAEVAVLSHGGRLTARLARSGVPHLCFPAAMDSPVGWLKNWQFLRALLARERFDVLHAHTRRCALLLRALPRKAKAGIGALPTCYRTDGVRRALAPLRVVTAHAAFEPRYRRLSYWGERTLAVSADIAAHLRRHFALRHPIHVIANGIELPAKPPERRTRRDTLTIVHACRLDEDCSTVATRLLHLAPALQGLARQMGQRLRLVLIGGGSAYPRLLRLREKILAAHAATLADAEVMLTGALSDVRPYLTEADVFVGVSRAALEALAAGSRVLLAGDEGYGGALRVDNFERFARGNFCCRGEGVVTDIRLLHDLQALFTQTTAATDPVRLFPLLRRHCDVTATAAQTLEAYAGGLASKRRLRVAVVGYFGRGNLGDEAILRALARRFSFAVAPNSLADAPWQLTPPIPATQTGTYRSPRCRRPCRLRACRALLTKDGGYVALPHADPSCDVPLRLELCVLCHRPQALCRGGWRYAALAAVPARSPLALARALRRADALLYGGGELLQNASRHGGLSLSYYLALPLLARLLGCPFSVRAGGVGMLRGWAARQAVRAVLSGAVGISLRDEGSRQRLIALGLDGARLIVCSDAVADWVGRREAGITADRTAQRDYVVVCPRQSDTLSPERIALLQRTVLPTLPRVFLAIGGEGDAAVCYRLAASEGGTVQALTDERAAYALLSRARAVISMRLHALILAGKAPSCFAIPDAASACKLSGYPLPGSEIDPEQKSVPSDLKKFEKGLYKRRITW